MLVWPLKFVQAYTPLGTAEFGDGRGAVMALEAKYRLGGRSRTQEPHHQLARHFASNRG